MKDHSFIYDLGENQANFNSFNSLANKTFGINFEEWKRQGYWGHQYIPYSYAENGTIIANVSVNTMDLICNGVPFKAVQLGTVMTAEGYRNQGLIRNLMQMIFSDYQDRCDFFYLFANHSVLDFYPKFGFNRMAEYQTATIFKGSLPKINVQKINMDHPDDKNNFMRLIKDSTPFAKISMVHNPSLIMFYCGSFMKDDLYYLPELDLAAVVEYDDSSMCINDIFSSRAFDLHTVINALLTQDEMKVTFGFTLPKEDYSLELKNDDDDVLFIKSASPVPFDHEMFPVLSHA
jgi:hypothetical protein